MKLFAVHSIKAAIGYAQLGMWGEALHELDLLSYEDREHPTAVALRVEILNRLGRWDESAALAESLVDRRMQHGALYLAAAEAFRETRSPAQARALLLKGEPLLREEWLWWFEMGCFACYLGELEEAKTRFTRAFEMDPTCRDRIYLDEGLRPLWDWCDR
jgi:tetratricopeptide (TPR) repeat protein